MGKEASCRDRVEKRLNSEIMGEITFSVVIPTYKRRDRLRRCLASLADQTLPKSTFEVVVVDDAAIAGLKASVEGSCPDVRLRVVAQEHLGPAAARNLGATLAKGRYLAFTDDDCRPAPNWLASLLTHLSGAKDTVAVGGCVINELKDDVFAASSQAIVDFLYDYFNSDREHATLLTSNNFSVPAAHFATSGGFDTAFTGAGGEDREFCLRWCHRGGRLVYAPDALVYHAHDMTLMSFIRQHLAYGYGGGVLRRCATTKGFGPIPLEPFSFYTSLLRYPRVMSHLPHPWLSTALFAVSQVANGIGYYQARIEAHMEDVKREMAG